MRKELVNHSTYIVYYSTCMTLDGLHEQLFICGYPLPDWGYVVHVHKGGVVESWQPLNIVIKVKVFEMGSLLLCILQHTAVIPFPPPSLRELILYFSLASPIRRDTLERSGSNASAHSHPAAPLPAADSTPSPSQPAGSKSSKFSSRFAGFLGKGKETAKTEKPQKEGMLMCRNSWRCRHFLPSPFFLGYGLCILIPLCMHC